MDNYGVIGGGQSKEYIEYCRQIEPLIEAQKTHDNLCRKILLSCIPDLTKHTGWLLQTITEEYQPKNAQTVNEILKYTHSIQKQIGSLLTVLKEIESEAPERVD